MPGVTDIRFLNGKETYTAVCRTVDGSKITERKVRTEQWYR